MQQLVLLDVLDVASRIDTNTYGRVADLEIDHGKETRAMAVKQTVKVTGLVRSNLAHRAEPADSG